MLPPEAYDLAAAQHGVIARAQLRRWLRDDQIDHRIGPGRELQPSGERGCYLLAGTGYRHTHAAFAAALRARPRATVTGPVVLGILGIDAFIGTELFTILTQPGRRLRGVRFPHRTDPDPRRRVTRAGDIRLTRPIDALIDSAAFVDRLGERSLRVAYDHLRWRGELTATRLRHRLQRLGGRAPGGAILHDLLETDGWEPESEGERLLGTVLRTFDPAPVPQVYVTPRRRVDWFFPPVRFAYEYLGAVDHRGVAARIADDARDRELRDQGIAIGYITSVDLREPQALLASIAGRLTVRAHELGVEAPILRRIPDDNRG